LQRGGRPSSYRTANSGERVSLDAAQKQGIEVELAPCAPEGWPREDYLVERLHDPRVRALAVSFVQFPTATVPISVGWRACRANGTFLVVDGIQGWGTRCSTCARRRWNSGVRRAESGCSRPGIRVSSTCAGAHPRARAAVTGWMAFEGTPTSAP